MQESPSRKHVEKMFNRIAGRYDLINRILSFGLDIWWRKSVVGNVRKEEPLRVLDLATGTGDLLIELCRKRNVASATGLDPSVEMMQIGKEKCEKKNIDAVMVEGMAEELPFLENAFDVITMGFGIRNTVHPVQAIREMYRVLDVGGQALILEFSLPENRMIKKLHLFYLRNILPKIGGLLSGDEAAYRYLNKTIETFPHGSAFLDLMKEAGFSKTKAIPLTFGIVTIYIGEK